MPDAKPSILIVDDEEDVLTLLQLVFETNGFSARTASNGKSAVSSAYENPPDVILLDVMMPEMDGWQVLRSLKGDERTRHIPVAMLSALNRPHEIKVHVKGAIKNGLSKDDIKEVFLQVAIYCGVPAAVDSFRIAREAFKEMGI